MKTNKQSEVNFIGTFSYGVNKIIELEEIYKHPTTLNCFSKYRYNHYNNLQKFLKWIVFDSDCRINNYLKLITCTKIFSYQRVKLFVKLADITSLHSFIPVNKSLVRRA